MCSSTLNNSSIHSAQNFLNFLRTKTALMHITIAFSLFLQNELVKFFCTRRENTGMPQQLPPVRLPTHYNIPVVYV